MRGAQPADGTPRVTVGTAAVLAQLLQRHSGRLVSLLLVLLLGQQTPFAGEAAPAENNDSMHKDEGYNQKVFLILFLIQTPQMILPW